jgi:hypothetical protein
MTETRGIDYFGRNLPFTKLHIKAALQARRKIYQWFKCELTDVNGLVFLDHGSTPDISRVDSNCFIRWLLEDGAVVYATSPEDISHLERFLTGLKIISWDSDISKFGKIDYIVSSAVIEHVGSEKEQIRYICDLLEISNNILITTPNRYHWLEFHTKIPILHWLPRHWHRLILRAIGMNFWASESNLHLLSKKDLSQIINTSSKIANSDVNTIWYEHKFLGMVSNLVVLISRK